MKRWSAFHFWPPRLGYMMEVLQNVGDSMVAGDWGCWEPQAPLIPGSPWELPQPCSASNLVPQWVTVGSLQIQRLCWPQPSWSRIHFIISSPGEPGYYIFTCKSYCLILWASQVALMVKTRPATAGSIRDPGSIPGWGRSPGGGNGNPLRYSCLENPMDRGAWWLHSPQGHKELDMTEAMPYPCVSLNFFNYKADVDYSHPVPNQGSQWARWVSVRESFINLNTASQLWSKKSWCGWPKFFTWYRTIVWIIRLKSYSSNKPGTRKSASSLACHQSLILCYLKSLKVRYLYLTWGEGWASISYGQEHVI